MRVIAYYLVEGRHFCIRQDKAGFSLWHHGAWIATVKTKRTALAKMREMIHANLDDRAAMAMHVVSDLQAARGLLATGGIEPFKILDASHAKPEGQ